MRRQVYILIAMIVLVGSLAVSAQAQNNGRTQMVNIPFEFSVSGQTLPAGEYVVRQINQESANAILQIRSRDGHSNVLIQMDSVIGKQENGARLIFNRYDKQYFFSQAWTPGTVDGLVAHKSRSERAAEKELARLGSRSEAVALTVR